MSLLRPKHLNDKPIREATSAASEVRALNRVIAADKGGETIPYQPVEEPRPVLRQAQHERFPSPISMTFFRSP